MSRGRRSCSRKAAIQNYASAQETLGWMHLQGKGVKKNEADAAKWFRLAADQRYASAQNNLGMLFEDGKGAGRITQKLPNCIDKRPCADTAGRKTISQSHMPSGAACKDPVEACVWFSLAEKHGDTKRQDLWEAAKKELKADKLAQANKRVQELAGKNL